MEDPVENLLKRHKKQLQEQFELPSGHEKRFLNKLQAQQPENQKKGTFLYYKVAAVLIPLIVVTVYFWPKSVAQIPQKQTTNLATYSPQLNKANQHFTYLIAINKKKVLTNSSPENRQIVNQSIKQLEKLQIDYKKLVQDLQKSGGNPRVIKAILLNLNNQIKTLQVALDQIKTQQKFKTQPDETLL